MDNLNLKLDRLHNECLTYSNNFILRFSSYYIKFYQRNIHLSSIPSFVLNIYASPIYNDLRNKIAWGYKFQMEREAQKIYFSK